MDTITKNWLVWFQSLLAATIGGAANAVTVMILEPTKFNFDTGWNNLWRVALVSAVVGAALFLKQSPFPELLKKEETHKIQE